MKNTPDDFTSHDRLAKVGEILARGIWRLKQREQKERENGLYESMTEAKHQEQRD